MNEESAERQPLISSNASDRPPVYSSGQFPVDEGTLLAYV